MTGLVPDNLGKEYYVGAGGKADAARAAVGLAIWVGFMVWTWPSVFEPAQWGEIRYVLAALFVSVLLPLGLIGMIAYSIMNERNARITVRDDGLVIQNWRKSRKLIVWDSICRLVWHDKGLIWRSYWLIPVVRDTRGRPRRRIIWMAPNSQAREVEQLRDEIIVHCDLFESGEQVPLVLQPLMLFLGLREIRIWRRHGIPT